MDDVTRGVIRKIVREAMRDAVGISKEDLPFVRVEEEREVVAGWAVEQIALALGMSPPPNRP